MASDVQEMRNYAVPRPRRRNRGSEMNIDIQPHALGFFAYVTDGDRLVACGEPRACPIEAVHVAAEKSAKQISRIRKVRRARNEHQAQTVRADQRGGWGGSASDCRSTRNNHNHQPKRQQQARNDLRTA